MKKHKTLSEKRELIKKTIKHFIILKIEELLGVLGLIFIPYLTGLVLKSFNMVFGEDVIGLWLSGFSLYVILFSIILPIKIIIGYNWKKAKKKARRELRRK